MNFVVKSLDNPANGRFINKDPIDEAGGNNLYPLGVLIQCIEWNAGRFQQA